MNTVHISSPLGILSVTGNEQGLCSVAFCDDAIEEHMEIPEILQQACMQLREYFQGKRPSFDIPLQPKGTSFQKKVWKELTDISYGRTITYQELANRLGDPKVVRAAAAANGKNPLAIIIPCHRVIGSDGTLTGYAGGLLRKKWLLEHESPVRQETLF